MRTGAPSIAVIWIGVRRTEDFRLGQSRIGGVPDLPKGAPWPRHRWPRSETKDWPDWAQQQLTDAIARGEVLEEARHVALALSFMAQLDLAELAHFDLPLPKTGHLWLFAEEQTSIGDIDGYPACAGACLYADGVELVRCDPPPTPETLPGNALTFAVPDGAQAEPRHQLFPEHYDAVIGEIPPRSYQPILLVDSDYANDPIINFGDAAWLTFAIPPAALAERRWDEMRAFRFVG